LFKESLLRIKFSREKAPLIRPSPDWLVGRLLVVDLSTLDAARDILCAVVSSLGVTGAEAARVTGAPWMLLPALVRPGSVNARLPRRSSCRVRLCLGVGGRSISVDNRMAGVDASLAPSK
jgi:hypothetical protein